MTTVINRGDERRCDHGADARQLRQPPTSFIRPAKAHKLSVEFVEPKIESAEFLQQIAKELPREIRELRVRDGVLRLSQKAPCALG